MREFIIYLLNKNLVKYKESGNPCIQVVIFRIKVNCCLIHFQMFAGLLIETAQLQMFAGLVIESELQLNIVITAV